MATIGKHWLNYLVSFSFSGLTFWIVKTLHAKFNVLNLFHFYPQLQHFRLKQKRFQSQKFRLETVIGHFDWSLHFRVPIIFSSLLPCLLVFSFCFPFLFIALRIYQYIFRHWSVVHVVYVQTFVDFNNFAMSAYILSCVLYNEFQSKKTKL